ncbi:hypothetical protein KCP77_12830 [Salmonella enterica subsp. enterica]|nr:hypothetical protein KCP77_12830 [Salmonella enterica subsp. enterica]
MSTLPSPSHLLTVGHIILQRDGGDQRDRRSQPRSVFIWTLSGFTVNVSVVVALSRATVLAGVNGHAGYADHAVYPPPQE